MQFYTTRNYMRRQYDRLGRKYAFDAADIPSYERWKAKTRARLIEIAGIDLCMEAPLEPKLLESARLEGCTREQWLIQTEPEVFMPFYLLRPDKPNGAAMLNPHGHGGGKENSVGNYSQALLSVYPEIAKREPFSVTLAKNGYTVACPDARGSGARREAEQQGDEPEKARLNSHREINQMAIGFGQCMLGYMVWDLMRLIDFVADLPEIDEKRIGCVGMSGGGQQTIYLAALDERVSLAVTSGYFYGFKEALMLQPANCSCNFIPNIWRTLDMGDIGALIAPRPFLVESGKLDHLNGAPGIDNVIPQVDIARSAYSLFGAQEKLFHSIHEEGHKWNGKDALPFIQKYL